MSTKIITVKSLYIGRIDEDLCREYEKTCGENLSRNILRLMENSFGMKIECKEDINKINELLRYVYYENIGEWLKGVMRSRVTAKVGDPEELCPFKCRDCAKFNCGQKEPIMSDGNTRWYYCPEWQCGVDPDNNKGISGCFSIKTQTRYTAQQTQREGQQGYMVSVYHGFKKVSQTFVPEAAYDAYCQKIKEQPELL